jgi:hypothetical protein
MIAGARPLVLAPNLRRRSAGRRGGGGGIGDTRPRLAPGWSGEFSLRRIAASFEPAAAERDASVDDALRIA